MVLFGIVDKRLKEIDKNTSSKIMMILEALNLPKTEILSILKVERRRSKDPEVVALHLLKGANEGLNIKSKKTTRINLLI